jgi:hypothetical protein
MMGYPLHLFTVELYYFEFGFVKGHMANGGGSVKPFLIPALRSIDLAAYALILFARKT